MEKWSWRDEQKFGDPVERELHRRRFWGADYRPFSSWASPEESGDSQTLFLSIFAEEEDCPAEDLWD